jgi:hypothetical protein
MMLGGCYVAAFVISSPALSDVGRRPLVRRCGVLTTVGP